MFISVMNGIPVGNLIFSLCNFGKTEDDQRISFSNERHLWKSNIPLCQPHQSGEEGWKRSVVSKPVVDKSI